jgi:hypothetical protein
VRRNAVVRQAIPRREFQHLDLGRKERHGALHLRQPLAVAGDKKQTPAALRRHQIGQRLAGHAVRHRSQRQLAAARQRRRQRFVGGCVHR